MSGAKKNILVTGGAGYVGSHACKALKMAGFQPITFDNLSSGQPDLVRWGPLEQGDIRDEKRLTEVLRNYAPQAVMHFAALSIVSESVSEPLRYYDTNVGGTLTLLKSMRQMSIKQIIFSSSAAVYGIPKNIPITEKETIAPVNPYGDTKAIAEKLLEASKISDNLRYVSLRYFNAAGADPENDTGETHDPETHLIPLVIRAAAGNAKPIAVFGDSYATEDGTCIRDYVHVSDLAEAHVLSLKHLLAGGKSLVCNLGTGKGYSVKQIIDQVTQIAGKEVPKLTSDPRPGDPPILISSNERATKKLGWVPKHSDLKTIINTAWNWEYRDA